MIEIKNLVKVYGSGNDKVVALDHIDLVLPNTGLVFVLGKSGCGKSTLLNMLGGLDDITSGDILFDGASIAGLSESELANFRADTVSTIYQNFNLFPAETVYQNIILGAKKSGDGKTSGAIDKILDNLGLLDKKHTLVKNLSGGQRQRVAIARTLIKDTPVILADEPTGNLDSKNTKITFDILKEISGTKLVVVVSHDIKSAEAYADRIISISDGQIVDDKTRNLRYIETGCKKLVLPEGSDIPQEELQEINAMLFKHRLEVSKGEGIFKKTPPKVVCHDKIKPNFKKRRKRHASGGSISLKFLKSGKASFIVTAVILSILVAMLAFAKNFIEFDAGQAIGVVNSEYNAKAYTLFKGYSFFDDIKTMNKSYLVECTDEDEKAFRDSGYEGNIYPIYDFPVGASGMSTYGVTPSSGYERFYSDGCLGLAVVDLDYLERTFGKVEVLAGSLYNLDKTDGLIVTDYYADSIIDNYKDGTFISDDPHDKYQKVTNVFFGNGTSSYKIGAIINTGYAERYKYILEQLDKAMDEPQNAEEIKRELYDNPIVNAFLTEVETALNIAYTINPNFEQTLLSMSEKYSGFYSQNIQILDDDEEVITTVSQKLLKVEPASSPLSKGEIIMGASNYNALFGRNASPLDGSGFVEEEITFRFLKYDEDSKKDKGLLINFKIVGIFDESGDTDFVGYISNEDYTAIRDDYFYVAGYLFDNVSQCYDVYSVGKPMYFYSNIAAYNTVFTICDIIEIFEDIFIFIFIALLVIATLLIIFHNLRLIKRNQYLIGVYKSLGYRSGVFSTASTLNSIYLDVAVYGLSVFLSFATSKLVNYVMTESFATFMNFTLVKSMTLVDFSIGWISAYVAILLAVSLASLLIPVLSVKKLKPNLILNKAVE